MVFYLYTKPFSLKTRLKDYYRTLEVSPAATVEDIRKSFRKLAFKYHPDQNEGNTFYAAQFIELKEAYAILSDSDKRYRYDQERWLLGMSNRANNQRQTNAGWLKGEAGRLKRHMEKIDAYRMDHSALQHYVLHLLSDGNMAVLEKDPAAAGIIVGDILAAIQKMKAKYMPPVLERLKLLTGSDEALTGQIEQVLAIKIKEEKKDTYFPLIVVLTIVVLMLITMIVLSR